jgi:hypothetical protein
MVDYTDYVNRLYLQELGREPDAGARGWIDALNSGALTPEQVQQMIDASAEGAVFDAYQTTFNRGLDQVAYNWVDALNSGAITEQQLYEQLRQSPEYLSMTQQQAPAPQPAPAPAPTAPRADYGGLLSSYYQQELGRAPDAGQQGWLDALNSGALTPEQVRQRINDSSEGYVYDLYNQYFNRGLDPSAYQWVSALESGGLTREQVMQGLMNSPEYMSRNGNRNPTTPTTPKPTTPTLPKPTTPASPYGPNVFFPTGPYSNVSVFDNYSPMRPLPSPNDQPFGFLYDTINQRLGRDVSARGLLDTTNQMSNLGSTPQPTFGGYVPSAQQQTPATTGGYAGSGVTGGGYSPPGPTNSDPNMVGGLLGAQSLVRSAYSDLLGRAPDDAGLTSWSNAVYGGMTQQQLYDAIRTSAEYQSRMAAPAAAETSYGYVSPQYNDNGGAAN